MNNLIDPSTIVTEKELPKLFDRFFRASTSEGISGTGIGLHIIQQFIKLHQGRIEVESEEGKTTTFSVYLPLKPGEEEEQQK